MHLGGLVSSLNKSESNLANESQADVPKPLLSPGVRRGQFPDFEATVTHGEQNQPKYTTKLSWPNDNDV